MKRTKNEENIVRHRSWIGVFVAAVLMAVAVPVWAQVSGKVPVQGFVTDDAGVPLDGEQTFSFALYAGPTETTAIHEETASAEVDAGAFTVYLEPPLEIFSENQEVFLGLAVNGGEELEPRIELGTVPYAAVAGNVAQVGWSQIEDVPTEVANPPTAGAGLGESSGAFVVDFTQVQARVIGGCPAGEYVTEVEQDGSLVCGEVIEVVGMCPAGEYVSEVAADGTLVCGEVSVLADGTVVDADVAANAAINPTKIAGTAATLGASVNVFTGDVEAAEVTANDFTASGSVTSPLVTASSYQFATAQTRYLNVPAVRWELTSGAGRLINEQYWSPDSLASRLEFKADVSGLPDGAIVTGLNCAVRENDCCGPGNDIILTADIREFDFQTDGFRTLVASSFTPNVDRIARQISPTSSVATPPDNRIDYERHGYNLSAAVTFTTTNSNQQRFYGCRVEYQVGQL